MALLLPTYWFFALIRIVIDDWFAVQHEEDSVSREFGFCKVGNKRTCLSNGCPSKEDGDENSENVEELYVRDVVCRSSDEDSSKSKNNGIEEEDDASG